jgi:hypothetical protein
MADVVEWHILAITPDWLARRTGYEYWGTATKTYNGTRYSSWSIASLSGNLDYATCTGVITGSGETFFY